MEDGFASTTIVDHSEHTPEHSLLEHASGADESIPHEHIFTCIFVAPPLPLLVSGPSLPPLPQSLDSAASAHFHEHHRHHRALLVPRRPRPRQRPRPHPRSDVGQVCVPAARFLDGCSQQHPCDPEDDQLHLHVSWPTETKPVQRQLRTVPVKVCPLALHLTRSVVIITWEPPMQSGRYHRPQRCWKVHACQAFDCA